MLAFPGEFATSFQWLWVPHTDGIRAWNLENGENQLAIPQRGYRNFRVSLDNMIGCTSNQTGVELWDLADSCRYGKPPKTTPQTISTGGPVNAMVIGRDSRTFAIHHRDQNAKVVHFDRLKEPVEIGEHHRIHYLSLSHDCKQLATGTLFGKDVRIWDAATGKMLRELSVEGSASVEYSPDGKWLVLGTETMYIFCDATTWQLHHWSMKEPESTPSGISFSADSKIVVVRHSPNQLRILDPSTGIELATLRPPGHQIMSWHRLSPDGNYLAAAGAGNLIFLWDIGSIRRQMADRGLDW